MKSCWNWWNQLSIYAWSLVDHLQVARAAVTQELSGGFDNKEIPNMWIRPTRNGDIFWYNGEDDAWGFKNFKRSGSKQRRSLVFQDQLVVLMGKDDETSISRTEARWSTSLRSWKRTGAGTLAQKALIRAVCFRVCLIVVYVELFH